MFQGEKEKQKMGKQEKPKMAQALLKFFTKMLNQLPQEEIEIPISTPDNVNTVKNNKGNRKKYYTEHYEEKDGKQKHFHLCHCGAKLYKWNVLCYHFEKSHSDLLPNEEIVSKFFSPSVDTRNQCRWNCFLCNYSISANDPARKKMHLLALHEEHLKQNTEMTCSSNNHGKENVATYFYILHDIQMLEY